MKCSFTCCRFFELDACNESIWKMKRKLIYLQVVAWMSALALFYVYLSARLGNNAYSFAIALSSFGFFVAIIYGYVFVIHKRYYTRVQGIAYGLLVTVFFAVIFIVRLAAEVLVVAKLALEPTIF